MRLLLKLSLLFLLTITSCKGKYSIKNTGILVLTIPADEKDADDFFGKLSYLVRDNQIFFSIEELGRPQPAIRIIFSDEILEQLSLSKENVQNAITARFQGVPMKIDKFDGSISVYYHDLEDFSKFISFEDIRDMIITRDDRKQVPLAIISTIEAVLLDDPVTHPQLGMEVYAIIARYRKEDFKEVKNFYLSLTSTYDSYHTILGNDELIYH